MRLSLISLLRRKNVWRSMKHRLLDLTNYLSLESTLPAAPQNLSIILSRP